MSHHGTGWCWLYCEGIGSSPLAWLGRYDHLTELLILPSLAQ